MNQRVAIISLAWLLVAVHTAGAYQLFSVDGTWSNPVNGQAITFIDGVPIGYGNHLEDQIRWGLYFGADDPANKSGLGFTGREPSGAPVTFGDGEPFAIGQLQHFNKTIDFYTAVTQVDLGISVDFSDPVGLSHTFQFTMSIDETPNTDIPPDDIIGFPAGFPSTTFVSGGYAYTLTLLGFGDSPDNLTSQFISPEYANNTTTLWGQLTAAPVPAPGAVVLGGLGTCVVSWLRRRRAL